MVHRLSPQAVSDLDDIVVEIVENGGSFKSAERLVGALTHSFLLLSNYPFMGRSRDFDLGNCRRSHVVESYVVVYRVDGPDVLILRVVHGRRDLERLFP